MKWYSVKKYRPSSTLQHLFVRTAGGSYESAYYIEQDDGGLEFHYTHDTEDEIEEVTHFCIPDPIEVEE